MLGKKVTQRTRDDALTLALRKCHETQGMLILLGEKPTFLAQVHRDLKPHMPALLREMANLIERDTVDDTKTPRAD